MTFINSLGFWPWLLLLVLPPLVVLLYFLKLKRLPLEVPSTYLWRRTIEDLHVNSLWQRLRRSLLLVLQLLLLALLMLACLRPGWQGAELTGDRFLLLIDTSASMSATDQQPTRLEVAKKRAEALIDRMQSGDVAMIISFSDRARIEQSFTDNRALLRRKLKAIAPTRRTSNLNEALRAAAGLANPGQATISLEGSEGSVDVELESRPATLYIFSDGGFPPVTDFALGNLSAHYVPIGSRQPDNVAIVAFNAERNSDNPEQIEAFAQLENFGSQQVTADVTLYVDGRLRDADQLTIPAGSSSGITFELIDPPGEAARGHALRLQLQRSDHLAVDNVAYAAANVPRRAQVLLVTAGNDALRAALSTEAMMQVADVQLLTPEQLKTKEYRDAAAAGKYDLIIYDNCSPPQMPQANTLVLGSRPPAPNWKFGPLRDVPLIIDTDRLHPLMRSVEMSNVFIAEGFTVQPPPGGTALVDTNLGTLMAIGPREGFEDAVMGFGILGTDEQGQLVPNTDWPRRLSFPIFVQNAVTYLGGVRQAFSAPSVLPGQPVTLYCTSPVPTIEVQSPSGRRTRLDRRGQQRFVFSDTDEPGIYAVREGNSRQVRQRFVVNLFDRQESDLRLRPTLPIGHTEVQGSGTWQPARKELWRWLLLAGLVVLLLEWYVYNRRVFL